jgi:hypothetical protein
MLLIIGMESFHAYTIRSMLFLHFRRSCSAATMFECSHAIHSQAQKKFPKSRSPFAPVTDAPATDAPVTNAPSMAPSTPGPTSQQINAPVTVDPVTIAPSKAPIAPDPTPQPTDAPVTNAPSKVPITPGPTPQPTDAPVTNAPSIALVTTLLRKVQSQTLLPRSKIRRALHHSRQMPKPVNRQRHQWVAHHRQRPAAPMRTARSQLVQFAFKARAYVMRPHAKHQ